MKPQRFTITFKHLRFYAICIAAASFCIFSVCLPNAFAGNQTIAQTVSVTSLHTKISLSAPYSGDDNADNSLLVEWGLNGIDFALGSQAIPHSSSPYIYKIKGLDNGKAYQIRVVYVDENDPNPSQILTNVIPNNPLIHNSLSTGSDKWQLDGWGVEGGKYGEFTCSTCHTRQATNIKRVRPNLTAPDGAVQFPIQAASPPENLVAFVDARAGSSDYGDDSDGHATSTKICEACHSITKYHRYDTLSDPDDSGPLLPQMTQDHHNLADCISCHPHRNGFAHGGGGGANCESCHGHDGGYEYESGKYSEGRGTATSHSTHTENDSDDLRGPHLACDSCHDTDNFPDFKSGTDFNDNGGYDLAETDVCDDCHSAGGAFNGIISTEDSIGAKDNWSDGIYNGANLQVGKERWCVGCHDNCPSAISGEIAPNKAGDNSSNGYYVTGHGRITNYNGMSWQDNVSAGNPGANQACTACHDSTGQHIDAIGSSSRLKEGYQNDQSNSNCVNCHKAGGSAMSSPDWFISSAAYESSAHADKLCTDCHDVHGSTGVYTGMTRADKQALCSECHTNGGHPGVGSVSFTHSGKSYTLQCVSCHNVHLVTGTYAQADQDKSPVTKFSNNTNVWGDETSEKMSSYAGSGTYRTPNGESFTGDQLPDYASFCTDCHSQPGDPPFGIDWSNDPHGKNAANMPNSYGVAPNWYSSGKAEGWDNDDCIGSQSQCWPVISRGKGDQLWSRSAYNHEERITGANFTLSCTDCHNGHGTGTLGRANVNGGSFTSNWNSMCNNCHYYYSDWHAGMSCGNASCHISDRMSWNAATPHEMSSAHGSGATRTFNPDLVLAYSFENNLKDSGDWQMDGKWFSSAGSFTTGKVGQAGLFGEDIGAQVGTENSYWSTDAGRHGTWVYTEMKYNTSLEAWVYPTDKTKDEYTIFTKHAGIGDGGYRLSLKKVGDTLRAVFNCQIDDNDFAQGGAAGVRGAFSAVTIPLNAWTHIAATFDSAGPDQDVADPTVGRIRIYINGEDVTSSDDLGNNVQPAAGETSMFAYSENSPWNESICYNDNWCASEFVIGGFDWETTNFIGRIDEAKVWNVTKEATYFASYDSQAGPYISNIEGLPGSTQLTVSFSEGVYGGIGQSGSLETTDFVLNDCNGDNQRAIVSVIHTAGAATAVLTISKPLAADDLNADTLAVIAAAVYDEFDMAADTAAVPIGMASYCPTAPVLFDLNEPDESSYIMDDQSMLYGEVTGYNAGALTGSAFSGDGSGSHYINFPFNQTCLQVDRKMTVEARIKPTGIGSDNYVTRILARDGGGNYQLSVWRNNSWTNYNAPDNTASIALWAYPLPTVGDSWKPVLTDYAACPVVNDHWYLVRAEWDADRVGSMPGRIYLDDQGADGSNAGENWAGYVDCTNLAQSYNDQTTQIINEGDTLQKVGSNFTIGTNRGTLGNNTFNGLIDWIVWKDSVD